MRFLESILYYETLDWKTLDFKTRRFFCLGYLLISLVKCNGREEEEIRYLALRRERGAGFCATNTIGTILALKMLKHKQMRYALLFLSLFFLENSFAQILNLSFEYKDLEQIGQPVKGAEVIVKGKNKNYSSITDENGFAYFKLPKGPNYTIYIPKEEQQMDLQSGRVPGSKLVIHYEGYSPEYYHQMEIEDSLAQIEWDRQEAEWDSIAAINAKKAGEIYFYLINPEGGYVGGLEVFDEGKAGKALGSSNYYWKQQTCTSSVINANGPKLATKKKPGTYQFYARTGDGQYEWEGSYEIIGNQVITYPLELSKAKKVK
jgi:hypothetical protein